MADSKKYDGSQWVHSLRKLTTATEAVENPLYSDGTAITSYTIKGNTVQNGTPTPSNPVDVNGVGNKTANLLNPEGSWTDYGCSHSVSGGDITVTGRWFSYLAFTAKPNTTYSMKYDNVLNQHTAVYKNAVSGTPLSTTYTDFIKFTTDTDTQLYIVFYASLGSDERTVEYKNVRLYEGDYTSQTIPDFEPYGLYKIPILNGSSPLTPIYVSHQLMAIANTKDEYSSSGTTTYNIKKLVLDSNISITDSGTSGNYHRYSIRLDGCSNRGSEFSTDVLTTHYRIQTGWGNGNAYLYSEFLFISLLDSEYPNTTALKSFFTAQYAAGTPVTVYYILATPTTETVTAPEIPTTDGANTITVDTTVQPSEFTATWTGWHDSSVKEWDGSDWQ